MMIRKVILIGAILILSTFLLTYCNLPAKEVSQLQTPTLTMIPIMIINTTTSEPSLCENGYQPSTVGDSWIYAGNNSSTGDYIHKNTVSTSSDDSYTMESNVGGVVSTFEYSCTEAGLIAVNPIQQYLGTLLAVPNSQIDVNLISASGISLPSKINPGDNWQQIVEWKASTKDISMNGGSVMDYTAVGYEKITVPFGTFDTLRVDATFSIEVSPLRISAGTYTTTTWMVPNVGVIKSVGTSHIRGVDFTDRIELTEFTPFP